MCVCARVIVCASLVNSPNFTSLSSVHRGFGKQGFQCQGKSSGSFTNPSAAYGCGCVDGCSLSEGVLCVCVCVCVCVCFVVFRAAGLHTVKSDLLALSLTACWCWQAGVELKAGACQQ